MKQCSACLKMYPGANMRTHQNQCLQRMPTFRITTTGGAQRTITAPYVVKGNKRELFALCGCRKSYDTNLGSLSKHVRKCRTRDGWPEVRSGDMALQRAAHRFAGGLGA